MALLEDRYFIIKTPSPSLLDSERFRACTALTAIKMMEHRNWKLPDLFAHHPSLFMSPELGLITYNEQSTYSIRCEDHSQIVWIAPLQLYGFKYPDWYRKVFVPKNMPVSVDLTKTCETDYFEKYKKYLESLKGK